MYLVDTNTLLLIIYGISDPDAIWRQKRLNLFDRSDYLSLMSVIGKLSNILTTPNVLTEVVNLLGNKYIPYNTWGALISLINQTSEKFCESAIVINDNRFPQLGLTDLSLLLLRDEYKTLVTIDSTLADFARSMDIEVIDLIGIKNIGFKS